MVFLLAANDQPRVGVDQCLTRSHPVQVLRYVPRMALLYVYHLIRANVRLLYGCVPLLRFVLRGIRLRDVYFLLESFRIISVLILFLGVLCILGRMGRLGCLPTLRRVRPLHHDVATLRLATLLPLLHLDGLRAGHLRPSRKLWYVLVGLRRRRLSSLGDVLLLIHEKLELLLIQCLLVLLLFHCLLYCILI